MQKYTYKYGTIYHADVLAAAQNIESESVDCVITSPPYWQLRDYGYPEQWGIEPTYQEYLAHMQELMKELWRIVKPTGTVWVNLGDTYAKSVLQNNNGTGNSTLLTSAGCVVDNKHKVREHTREPIKTVIQELPDKCLTLVPHRFAINCIDSGWILRNDVIWAKPNAMPEPVTDRFSKKKEYVFFFVKQGKYYFDLDSVRERPVTGNYVNGKRDYQNGVSGQNQQSRGGTNIKGKNCGDVSRFWQGKKMKLEEYLELAEYYYYNESADIWEINTKPSAAEHYASYNLDLIKKPILAGCPVGGLIYDPFMGSGMSAIAAMEYGRRFIGSEASEKYIKISDTNILEREKQIENKKAQSNIFSTQAQ